MQVRPVVELVAAGGKRRRDCIDFGARVNYLGREHCYGRMRRLREHAAKKQWPD
jgi:hypothetical protein